MENGLPSFDEFTGLKLAGLESYDILALSFYGARGLPGTEHSNLERWYSKRDAWVYRVQFETARHLYRFDSKSEPPTDTFYGNSLGRFLCYFMLQVLQEDCGVRYHPDRKMNPASCKPADVFAHGIMDDDGEGGTCASMPIVYVSVGRRLGYPVHLVETRGHLFCRWDDPKGTKIRWRNPDITLRVPPERFNFDGSGEGISYRSDDYYKTWPEPWTKFEIEHDCYLHTRTARQALAAFLIERGECFWDFGMRGLALQSYHFARQLVPDEARYDRLHASRSRECEFDRIMLDHHQRVQQMRLGHGLGHLPGCLCTQCWHSDNRRNQLRPFGHGEYCQCFNCRKALEAAAPAGAPGHMPGCECFQCVQARDAAGMRAGIRGHVPGCGCAGCLRVRQTRAPFGAFPGLPGFKPF
ncbi:MAG: hypothetical protein EXS05_03375 [Planctomycetaceae bacterium]|nr:hypothetical protein [Planctomycetaceae bacterium]